MSSFDSALMSVMVLLSLLFAVAFSLLFFAYRPGVYILYSGEDVLLMTILIFIFVFSTLMAWFIRAEMDPDSLGFLIL